VAVTHQITDIRLLGGGLAEVDVVVNRGDGAQRFTVTISRDELALGQTAPREFAVHMLRRFLAQGFTLAQIKSFVESV
jgi:hypothetical protein